MRTTIDGAGRIVIPKAMRDALGLVGGSEVDIEIDGVAIRIDSAQSASRGFRMVNGRPVLDPVDGPELTAEEIRELRLGLQR
jgi:AbrB family looped-hinge helix DNA binding protein